MSQGNLEFLKRLTAVRLTVLFSLFFIFLLIAGGVSALTNYVPGLSERNVMLISSALQGLIAFCIPAWLTARFISTKPEKFLEIGVSKLKIKPFIGIIVVYFLAMPAMNQIVVWNESVHFPEWAGGIEKTLREWEETNGKVAEILLTGNTLVGMIITILVVGLITGFSEEIFFRGALQNIFSRSGAKNWIAVWGAAFIFSAMHFQFFGFIPRLLMGAFFGYLFIWSGNLWPSVFAHFLNNSIVVVSSWMAERDIFSDMDRLGVSAEGAVPYAAITSCIATILFIFAFKGYFFKSCRNYNKD